MSKKNIGKLYKQKENSIIELMMMRGLLPDKDIEDEQKQKLKQKSQRNCYHNTELLLKHYRDIAWTVECFPETIAEELEKPFVGTDRLMEQMDMEIALGNKKLENHTRSILKTRMLLDRVNEALSVLKRKPDNGKKLYDLIYQTYIAPEKLSRSEILYRLDISTRHYYRLRQQAITILSIRLWSAPTADIAFWIEILTQIEELE